jgi:hypothetical protein
MGCSRETHITMAHRNLTQIIMLYRNLSHILQLDLHPISISKLTSIWAASLTDAEMMTEMENVMGSHLTPPSSSPLKCWISSQLHHCIAVHPTSIPGSQITTFNPLLWPHYQLSELQSFIITSSLVLVFSWTHSLNSFRFILRCRITLLKEEITLKWKRLHSKLCSVAPAASMKLTRVYTYPSCARRRDAKSLLWRPDMWSCRRSWSQLRLQLISCFSSKLFSGQLKTLPLRAPPWACYAFHLSSPSLGFRISQRVLMQGSPSVSAHDDWSMQQDPRWTHRSSFFSCKQSSNFSITNITATRAYSFHPNCRSNSHSVHTTNPSIHQRALLWRTKRIRRPSGLGNLWSPFSINFVLFQLTSSYRRIDDVHEPMRINLRVRAHHLIEHSAHLPKNQFHTTWTCTFNPHSHEHQKTSTKSFETGEEHHTSSSHPWTWCTMPVNPSLPPSNLDRTLKTHQYPPLSPAKQKNELEPNFKKNKKRRKIT